MRPQYFHMLSCAGARSYAMGTSIGPRQAVAHEFMPVVSVGNPSRLIAAKMGVQRG